MREHLTPEPERDADDGSVVELTIPSQAEWVSVARLAVAGIASHAQFSIEDIEDLKVAVAEACTNCIQHATGSTVVHIRCRVEGKSITVTVEDRARRAELPDSGAAARAADGDKIGGGLGIFLIRSLMDEVNYEFKPGSGSRLTMIKSVAS